MALDILNKNLVKFAIFVIILQQFISNGSAIKCFVCDSEDNPSCADLKSNSSIVAEECTLDKMKSINTWLFELNSFEYFDTGAKRSPLMNCQKVVARKPVTNQLVTARFCQLNTGESDACAILRSKLRMPNEDSNGHNNNYRNQNGRQDGSGDPSQDFFCSICTTDNCNAAGSMKSLFCLVGGASVLAVLMSRSLQQMVFYIMW
ncbi:without maturity [Musca autumnalis]|uniref:without maturity n=1 Tax=Musca autumnalis TaxID=221902 RepID=UPI003CE89B16